MQHRDYGQELEMIAAVLDGSETLRVRAVLTTHRTNRLRVAAQVSSDLCSYNRVRKSHGPPTIVRASARNC